MDEKIQFREKNGDTESMRFKFENGQYVQLKEGEDVYVSVAKRKRNPFFIIFLPCVILASLVFLGTLSSQNLYAYQNIIFAITNHAIAVIFFLIPVFATLLLSVVVLGSFVYGCIVKDFILFKKSIIYWLVAFAFFIIAIGPVRRMGSDTGVYYHFLNDQNTGFTRFDKTMPLTFIKYLWNTKVI